MNLYQLDLNYPSFGKMIRCIVIAENMKQARRLASKRSYGEGRQAWLSASTSTCVKVELTIAGVISEEIAE